MRAADDLAAHRVKRRDLTRRHLARLRDGRSCGGISIRTVRRRACRCHRLQRRGARRMRVGCRADSIPGSVVDINNLVEVSEMRLCRQRSVGLNLHRF